MFGETNMFTFNNILIASKIFLTIVAHVMIFYPSIATVVTTFISICGVMILDLMNTIRNMEENL